MPEKVTCRRCGAEVQRAGGGWVHKDKSQTYDHPPRVSRSQDRPGKGK